jgi:DNA repair protein RecN (Recombination protein N)
VAAALEFAVAARAEQAALSAAAADPLALAQAVESAAAEFAAAADDLSRGRKRAARRLERAVEVELAELAMAGTRFRVALTRDEDPLSPVRLDQRPLRHDATGVDGVEFQIAPNAGEDLLPLARIASGGELSRLCLALESAIRARRSTAGCLVFDEVDAGIGGGVAAAVGEKLHRLGRERQVLCVTHLPQIASRADHHIRIAKRTEAGRTVTAVAKLDANGRVDEVARMLGGARITATTRRHAEEMLGRAR